ncbi:hypothetical protein Bca52824_014688 [Brassica carinata]|uniref:Arogenate dehydratase n=1 Tax=Brassica carinata TaxID=52824 RepID=A0A8X8B3N8_BRACI|nr:hypothetical protein Bca52824_014688 [Brassica carinata]
MAVHTVRLPATHLHTGTSRNISPSNRDPNAFIRSNFTSPKLRRFISVSSSLREDNEHGKENPKRDLEVKKIPEESPLLPKPLSSNQLSETVSNGSRVRVAYQLAVRHCLLANHGVAIEDLKRVLSHPQALAQCENTLTRLGLVREAVYDTAGAAKQIAFEGLSDAAAVASAKAAEIYGLSIVAEDIQDDSDNVTRFLMLAREPIIPGTNRLFKTSIVFSLEEGPGMLFKALAVFALREINLTKMESRPLRKNPLRASGGIKYFDYLFYVDFEASMADEVAQNALRHLEEFATFLRVLGSYPVDTTML